MKKQKHFRVIVTAIHYSTEQQKLKWINLYTQRKMTVQYSHTYLTPNPSGYVTLYLSLLVLREEWPLTAGSWPGTHR